MKRFALGLTAVLVVAVGMATASIRPLSAGGGGGGDDFPPLPGPLTLGGAPTVPSLGAGNGYVHLRLHTLSSPPRPEREHARIVVRQQGLPVDFVLAPFDVPVELSIPGGPGVSIDVLGSDALGVPVADGQVLRVLLP